MDSTIIDTALQIEVHLLSVIRLAARPQDMENRAQSLRPLLAEVEAQLAEAIRLYDEIEPKLSDDRLSAYIDTARAAAAYTPLLTGIPTIRCLKRINEMLVDADLTFNAPATA